MRTETKKIQPIFQKLYKSEFKMDHRPKYKM